MGILLSKFRELLLLLLQMPPLLAPYTCAVGLAAAALDSRQAACDATRKAAVNMSVAACGEVTMTREERLGCMGRAGTT